MSLLRSLPLQSEAVPGTARVRAAHPGFVRAVFVLFLTAVCIFVSVFRIRYFGNTEPRTDQATSARLVRVLRTAPRLLPARQSGESLRLALEADDVSALGSLTRFFM